MQHRGQLIEGAAASQRWGVAAEHFDETERRLCTLPLAFIPGSRPPTILSGQWSSRRLGNRCNAIGQARPLVIGGGKTVKRRTRPRVGYVLFFFFSQQMR